MSLTKAQRIVLSYPPIKQRLEKNELDQQKILKNLDEIKSTLSEKLDNNLIFQKSSSRPKDVIFKYKKLLRNSHLWHPTSIRVLQPNFFAYNEIL